MNGLPSRERPRPGLPNRTRLATLAGCRREFGRLYAEARADADPSRIGYFRMLAFILSGCADTLRLETQEELEARISVLEKRSPK